MSKSGSSLTTSGAPITPSSKASAAAPKVTSQDLEMSDLPANVNGGAAAATAAHHMPPDQDVMHLARTGDIPAMEKLFETGEYDATYTDHEGITPLHWASINNQFAMCQYLIKKGAEINKKGGESVATPLQWAAQKSNYYTVNLLLQHGADPLITDSQGYNTLHISTFSGSTLLITLLLHQGIPVDVADNFGHTGLMWAAYKGYPLAVDLFLRWGASVHATDSQGFTALHWALVKGSSACILKIIEYGADRFAKTETGKTPAITAQELNNLAPWRRALKECGYDEEGHPVIPWWPGASYFLQDKRTFMNRFLFLLPFSLIWIELQLMTRLPLILAVPLAALVGFGYRYVTIQILEYGPPDMRHLQKTPWLAGIFAGSLALVGLDWLFSVVPNTYGAHPLINFVFFGFFSLTAYFYASAMTFDPGFVPKMNGIAEQKAVIDDLLENWKFDENNFCVSCMIRTPRRSKHCKRCQRCVAKHDHHCPWINNCVGINNHRHFFLYLVFLTFGVLTYAWLSYDYLFRASEKVNAKCSLLSDALCGAFTADGYTFLLAIWACLQLTWVGMLLFVQFVQIARAMTTYENMYGINDGSPTNFFHMSSTGAPLDPGLSASSDAPPSAANDPLNSQPGGHGSHGHRHKQGFLQQWSRLLGVNMFIETATGRSAATDRSRGARKKRNPYSRGYLQNCRDFWCDPAPVFGRRETGEALLGGRRVNWAELYESPAMMEVAGVVGRSARTRGGYEAVASSEV